MARTRQACLGGSPLTAIKAIWHFSVSSSGETLACRMWQSSTAIWCAGYQRKLARQRTGPKGARRPLAISTRARRLVALRSFLHFAAREEWLAADLGAVIDVPKLPERLPKPLEASDLETLLYALPSQTPAEKRDRALVLLLLSTGARVSEILRLDRADWKPERLWIVGKGDRERVANVTERARAVRQSNPAAGVQEVSSVLSSRKIGARI
jgi:site-specific recombinase XerD